MDAVFKQYGVCEDVADVIAKKVHEGHQKKVNEHLGVIIGWDPRFDYWTFGNFKHKSIFWPYKEPSSLERISHVVLQGLRDRYNTVFKIKKMKKNLTKEEYMSYVLSSKKVFMMCRPVRWNRFVDALDHKYKIDKQGITFQVTPFSVYLSRTTQSMNMLYAKGIGRLELNYLTRNAESSSPDYDPIRYFMYTDKKIQKKVLISWLNKNGDPRKLRNKKKKELWEMIMKLK